MMYKSLKANPERTDCYANDWYCPLTSVYDLELSEKLRAKGHQVWWYTCCGPKHPYANMATTDVPMHSGTTKQLKVGNSESSWSIYDDTVTAAD